MTHQHRVIIIVIIIIVIIVGSAGFVVRKNGSLNFWSAYGNQQLIHEYEEVRRLVTPAPVDQLFNTTNYTKSGYVVPFLSDESVKNLDVPSRIQIRGTVYRWFTHYAIIQVNSLFLILSFDNATPVACFSDVFTQPDGSKVSSDSVYVNMASVPNSARKDARALQKLFPIGVDVAIVANQGNNGSWKAQSFAGFGCSL